MKFHKRHKIKKRQKYEHFLKRLKHTKRKHLKSEILRIHT